MKRNTVLPIVVMLQAALVASAFPLPWIYGFVENRGQWEIPCTYLYARPGLIAGVTPTGLVFDVYDQAVEVLPHGRYEVPQTRIHRKGRVIWMELEGAVPGIAHTQLVEPAVLHFFRGNSSQRWQTNIPVARMVELSDVYPGITLRLWGLPEGPRYDFVLQPGADPRQIRLCFRGADRVTVEAQGTELRLYEADKSILLHANLRAYQEVGQRRRDVPVSFVLQPAGVGVYRVSFAVGDYDPRYPLVIDPIVYATCIGSGSDERAPSLYRLADGSVLTVVQAEELSFRMTPGAYDTTYNGLTDVVVVKLDAMLRQLLFATYLGGSASEFPALVGVDANGEIFVGGSTNSTDLPVRNAYQQTLRGGVDLFVTRLVAQGSQLRWSTYVGGSSDDIAVTGSVRRDGIVVLAGRTQSSNYPTTSGAYQRTYNANWDAFITGLSNTGASLSFSTYLGGSDNETAWSVYTDPEGYTYVCGETSSSNFPNYPVPTIMNPGNRPYDRDYNGGVRDAFVAKFRPTSATLQYSTFLGGGQEDYATGVVAKITVKYG
ncbi:MAG: SBBP repeat-containing protein [Bacteroidota bacterium]|nr:SBBP repeat-containing protein [Bacteroidota bacterium]